MMVLWYASILRAIVIARVAMHPEERVTTCENHVELLASRQIHIVHRRRPCQDWEEAQEEGTWDGVTGRRKKGCCSRYTGLSMDGQAADDGVIAMAHARGARGGCTGPHRRGSTDIITHATTSLIVNISSAGPHGWMCVEVCEHVCTCGESAAEGDVEVAGGARVVHHFDGPNIRRVCKAGGHVNEHVDGHGRDGTKEMGP